MLAFSTLIRREPSSLALATSFLICRRQASFRAVRATALGQRDFEQNLSADEREVYKGTPSEETAKANENKKKAAGFQP